MSQTVPAGQTPAQIIIVRRNYDLEEAHHGGVWKIAFADFMTAMMAFFLVMWLTNASEDATKKQIAQYFNPIKLNSASPETLGLQDGQSVPTKQVPENVKGEVPNGGNPGEKPLSGTLAGGKDQALFRDPYAVLAEIAAEGGPGIEDGPSGMPDGSGLPGLNGGEAYRDPFDPNSWQLEPNIEEKAPGETPLPQTEFDKPTVAPAATLVTEVVKAEPAPKPAEPEIKADAPSAEKVDAPSAEEAAKAERMAAEKAEAEKLQAEIEKAAAAAAPGSAPGVEVSAGENGITISLADSLTSGMFEIGSAKPTPQAVKLVETISKLLQERKGEIAIRGHTDSRPYAGVEYDNWRLSAARAQFAYYMLVRGGLDEKRVLSIEGVADREPADATNPTSAVNRRIEILLKEPRA